MSKTKIPEKLILYILVIGSLIAFMIIAGMPLLIDLFDQGHDEITIEELMEGNEPDSKNFTVEGNLLLEHAYLWEDRDKNGGITDCIYYIPLVDSNWTKEDIVYYVIEYQPKKFWYYGHWQDTKRDLLYSVDSLRHLPSNRVKLEGQTSSLQFMIIEQDAKMSMVRQGLKIADGFDLHNITVNKRFSPFRIGFAILFLLILPIAILLLFKRYNKRKILKAEAIKAKSMEPINFREQKKGR